MADEKLNVSPEENPQPSLFDTGPADDPAPETSAPEPPAPENAPELKWYTKTGHGGGRN